MDQKDYIEYTRILKYFLLFLGIKNHNKDERIPKHFNQADHKISDLKIVGIEKIKHNDGVIRKVWGTFWLSKMKTLAPEGLGEKC